MRPLRAPLVIPRDLICGGLGDDAIIRTDEPQTLRCGSGAPQRGQRCTSGCKTKDHLTYAECLRDKGTKTYLASPSKGLDGTAQKRWDGELDRYRAARKEGIRPDGTTMPKVMDAIRRSDEAGAAYGRDFSKATPLED